MKKVLMYASVASMIQQFNMENIRLLIRDGYHVDIACNMEQGSSISAEKVAQMKAELEQMGCNVIHVPIPRKITAIGAMWKAFRETEALMNEQNYDLVHCHSPIGGIICRMANRFGKNYGKTRMIYTAHGFHFFKGAPKINWLLYYPAEKLCARFTDVLITINQEDYALSQKKMKARSVQYVPGIGVNLEQIAQIQPIRSQLCEQLGIPVNAKLMISVGELNDNKNHQAVVRAMETLPSDIHYLICGQGDGASALQEIAQQLGCAERLHLLGYRSDVLSVVKSCDLFVFPSKREGLSVALMEAMACGLPCIASNIRGNGDLLVQGGGMLLQVENFTEQFRQAVVDISDWPAYQQQCAQHNLEHIQQFSKPVVQKMMERIYVQP